MKASKILAVITAIVLVYHCLADTEEELAKQKEEDTSQELQTKQANVRAAKAEFDEAQRLFDIAAAELHEAHNQLQSASSELQNSQENLDDVVYFTSKFTEHMTPLPLTLARHSSPWNYQIHNAGVIGVALGDAESSGVLIKGVMETAPAYLAGVEAGDVILRIDDIDIADLEHPTESVIEVITSRQPGTVIRFTLLRNEDEMEVDVATIDRLSMERLRAIGGEWHAVDGVTINNAPVDPRIWNIITASIPGAENRVYVMEIEEDLGSYFDVEYGVLVIKAPEVDGLQAGDILLKVDEKPIRSLSHAFQHKHAANTQVEIQFKRKKSEKKVTLEKDQFSLHAILE